ncbi:MAG: maleate cis-trans isomerase family protein [Sciscionella sp.]
MTESSRVGLLIPSSNTVMERDLHAALDPPHRVHTARMLLADVTVDAERRMLQGEAMPAARRVAAARPDVVVFGCTSASALYGKDYDDEFRARLAEITGTPVLGVLSAVIDELAQANGIALFTPYVAELTDRIAESLRAADLPVVTTKGLGLSDNSRIGALEPSQIVSAVTEMNLDGADMVFCSCTNLRAVEARQAVSDATGLPVVTSNHAVIQQTVSHLLR